MENYTLQEIMIIPCFILVNFNQTKTALGWYTKCMKFHWFLQSCFYDQCDYPSLENFNPLLNIAHCQGSENYDSSWDCG